MAARSKAGLNESGENAKNPGPGLGFIDLVLQTGIKARGGLNRLRSFHQVQKPVLLLLPAPARGADTQMRLQPLQGRWFQP